MGNKMVMFKKNLLIKTMTSVCVFYRLYSKYKVKYDSVNER